MDIPKSFRAKQGIEEKTEQLIIGPKIKKELEEPMISKCYSFIYEDLTSEDLRGCNYSASAFKDMIIKFKSKNNRWYRVVYYNYDTYASPIIQILRYRAKTMILEDEKEEFTSISKQILEAHPSLKTACRPTFKNDYFTCEFKILNNLKTKDVANLLDDLYKKNFKDVFVYEARFCPINLTELEESGIPREKIRRTYHLGDEKTL